ncbi:DUF2608 domain-containing protein [Candidatus Babeliales bacterium]|nr:DUF2608 domain-containing protein [Candidatus Babeliales bacterium]
MNVFRIIIFSFLFILNLNPAGAIIERADFAQGVYEAFHGSRYDETILFVDLDETIITVANKYQQLGGDAWFSGMLSAGNPVEKVLPLYFWLQNYHIQMRLVDTRSPEVIKFFMDRGVRIYGLTSRSTTIAEKTVKTLNRFGVKFSPLNMYLGDLPHPCLGYSGVLFCDRNNKGDVVKNLLKTSGLHPKKVVFIDDKEKYLQQVLEGLEGTAIDFRGIRYSATDIDISSFDLRRANGLLVDMLSMDELLQLDICI